MYSKQRFATWLCLVSASAAEPPPILAGTTGVTAALGGALDDPNTALGQQTVTRPLAPYAAAAVSKAAAAMQQRAMSGQMLDGSSVGVARPAASMHERDLAVQLPAGMPRFGPSSTTLAPMGGMMSPEAPQDSKYQVKGSLFWPLLSVALVLAAGCLAQVSYSGTLHPVEGSQAGARGSRARGSRASARGSTANGGADTASGAEGTSGAEGAASGADNEVASVSSDKEVLDTDGLPEDTYGLAIASWVQDLQHMSKESGSRHFCIRVIRIIASGFLVLWSCLIQVALIYFIMQFAAAKAVMDVRSAYDAYQKHMYNGRVFLTEGGHPRGLHDRYFSPWNFESLDGDVKGTLCYIPMSQPAFLSLVLFIWTLTVVGDLREATSLFSRIWNTELASTMAKSVEVRENGSGDKEDVIVRMTITVKAFILFFILVPQIFMALVLLWLGSRWLTATSDMGNLVINTCGLEFALKLRCLLYNAMVPTRCHRDVQRLRIMIGPEGGEPSPMSFFGSFFWGFIAVIWVYLYIYVLQQVLPFYGWDVQQSCAQWLDSQLAPM